MNTNTRVWGAPDRRLPYEATVTAALLAVDLAARAEHPAPTPAAKRDWDAVHDAALDSFPASDAPSWSPLRIGPPASAPSERAFERATG
jgi:hypothetical protein